MNEHEKINYVEFPAKDIEATKLFFTKAFGWTFEDYGPDYIAFSNQGIDGGFYKSDLKSSTENGSALIVLYSNNLEQTQSKVLEAGAGFISATQTAMSMRSGLNKGASLPLGSCFCRSQLHYKY